MVDVNCLFTFSNQSSAVCLPFNDEFQLFVYQSILNFCCLFKSTIQSLAVCLPLTVLNFSCLFTFLLFLSCQSPKNHQFLIFGIKIPISIFWTKNRLLPQCVVLYFFGFLKLTLECIEAIMRGLSKLYKKAVLLALERCCKYKTWQVTTLWSYRESCLVRVLQIF